MRKLTASDRESLIKLASSLPKGDETRKAILSGLKTTSVDKTASVLSTKARAVRDSMETILDSLEGDGVFEPGDYYTMVLKWHQFLISLKNTVPDFDDSGVLQDMTTLIRLLQAQFS